MKRPIVDEALLDLGPELPASDPDRLRRLVWRLRAASASLSVQTRAYARANRRLAARLEAREVRP